jgi:hypothetical protein
LFYQNKVLALIYQKTNNMTTNNLTYDVLFSDAENSNNKGFRETLEYCQQYIKANNGTNNSYFADYKGGTVSIVCNETEEVVFETSVN